MIAVALTLALAPPPLRACQVGYLPSEPKHAVLLAEPRGDVRVLRLPDRAVVARGILGAPVLDPSSGDTVRSVDFSRLNAPGTYVLSVEGVGDSHPFEVGKGIFRRALYLSMRSFYGQRCGTAVDMGKAFPGYKYPACHTEPARFHESSGRAGSRDLNGGWHDAGDYGRYIVNSGITTGTLLWTYELNQRKLRGFRLDIPESGDKSPDFLDEIRWNLDWMLKMQDEDGGVWHKSTTANFPGMIMPQADKQTTLIIGTGAAPYKNTTATADFAAVMAIAGRLYRPFDAPYAAKCLAAAEKAWAWLEATPDHNFTRNPRGIATGGYGDNNPSDERLWAAAELFRTTGRSEFNSAFLKRAATWNPKVAGDGAQAWPEVRNMGMFTYLWAKGGDRGMKASIRNDALKAADEIATRVSAHPYRMPLLTRDYVWGSNAVVANYGMMLWIAHRLDPKPRYLAAAQDSLHYLLGRNTFGISYLTQVGTQWAMKPHHRPSHADGIEQPWPGLLVGGPNAGNRTPPARQWVDQMESYSTNENAINWNAALVFVLAEALDR